MTKSGAKDYIVNLLASNYKSAHPSTNLNPVLVKKNGKYQVANNWEDANYAQSLGWEVESMSLEETQKLGAKARKKAGI